MRERAYYSIRTGTNPNAKYDLPMLRRLFYQVYAEFERKYCFQEAFGYYCVDSGEVPGSLGSDIEAYLFRKLRKVNLWPIKDRHQGYTEDDVFDLVELLYDCVSTSIDGCYHGYNNCGWHSSAFDREAGRAEFRPAINEILRDYGEGFELVESGEVCAQISDDMRPLFEAPIPEYDPTNVTARVQAAKTKLRRRGASLDDKRDAIRDLSDVLEFLRPQIKAVLIPKDEDDLFNLANNFGIRHHNDHQKTDYDRQIWYDWMFFYYLSTINASLRLLVRADAVEPDDTPF